MWIRRLASHAAVLLATGCAQLWGIEDVTRLDGGEVTGPDGSSHQADAATGGCPAGMVSVPLSLTSFVCMDPYEESLDGSGVVSAAGRSAATMVTLAQAMDLCTASGKRLCHGSEWIAACRGPLQTTYPYGTAYEAGRCNGAGTSDGPLPTGSLPLCEGGFTGLFDMSGNVAEWTADCTQTDCPMWGGAYDTVDTFQLNCLSSTRAAPTGAFANAGFRCCCVPGVDCR